MREGWWYCMYLLHLWNYRFASIYFSIHILKRNDLFLIFYELKLFFFRSHFRYIFSDRNIIRHLKKALSLELWFSHIWKIRKKYSGSPKGAMMSHYGLIWNAQILVDMWKFSQKDVLLHMLPFDHIHGMFISLNCSLFSKSSVVFR